MSNNWKKYKLKDLVVSANTGLDAIKRAPIVATDTGVKCMRIQDVSQSKKFINWGFCEVNALNFEKFSLKKGEIIIARTGNTIGVNSLIKENLKAVFNNGLIRLRIKNDICSPLFLYQNFRTETYWNHINAIAFGTSTQPNMQIDSFLDFEISLPSLYEQQAIGEVISALDDKIELNLQTIKTLEEMADAVFKHWFVKYGPFKDGRFVESELGSIPDGWQVKSFKEICVVERGLSYKGEFLANSGKPLHNLNSIYEGGYYKYPGIKYYSGPYKERNTVIPGDLIVANTEQGHKYLLIGSPALIPKRFGNNGIFSHHLYKIVPSDENISKLYLFHWLLQKENRDKVTAYCNGTTVNMLKPAGFENPTLIIPDGRVIKNFDALIQPYLDLKEELIEENYSLTQTRDYLLPKLISGEVIIKDATKKVKEVL